MLRSFFILPLILLTGCDSLERALFSAMGPKTNTVILVNGQTIVHSSGLTLRSKDSMKVLGKDAAVCLVLANGTGLSMMGASIRKSLRDATITAKLKMKSGAIFTYSDIEPTWNRYGRLNSDIEETSACVTCACGPAPKVGDEVSEISIAPSSSVSVLGIYWESSEPLGGT
jgi:hypothetical protein